MTDKERRAERLLDAMDGIDERFLAEAIAAQKSRKRRRLPLRILAVAASAALVVTLAVAGGLALGKRLHPALPPATDGGSNACTTPAAFSALLLSCTESRTFTEQTDTGGRLAPDGTVRVVIGEKDGDTLWVSRPLTGREGAVAIAEASRSGRAPADRQSDAGRYRIWLIDRSGTVWSPSLCYSGGNVTFGQVYDYDPEYLPSAAFQTLLAGLAGEN